MKKFSFLLVLFLSASVFAADPAPIIKKISMKQDGTRYNIFIQGEGKLECNTILMDNPPRIALDFPNVKNSVYPNVVEAETNNYIDRIRTSVYAKGRDLISRVTVDLKTRSDYSVYKSKDGVILSLTAATTAAKTPSTKSPNTTPNQKQTNQQTTGQPTTAQPQAGPITSGPIFVPPPPPDHVQDIVIGNEDLLEITVFELPQFNTSARVQGDGSITMPLVGSIPVRGLKKKEVEAKISEALQTKYVNNANVSVTVKEYKSRQVNVLGMVKSPGAYYVMSSRTLVQLLSEAGGLAPGAGNRCFIFRPGSPKIEINLFELMNNGNPEMNISIYPGDVVSIPVEQKITIYVFGAVKTPGAIQLDRSKPVTLMSAIAEAGGPTTSAKESDIKIKRKSATGQDSLIKA